MVAYLALAVLLVHSAVMLFTFLFGDGSEDSLHVLEGVIIHFLDHDFILIFFALRLRGTQLELLLDLGVDLSITLLGDLVEDHGPNLRLAVHAVLAGEGALLHLLKLKAFEYELI